ncbi:uncharacterized protein LOC134825005 [Bolinopsis microptera]|uniref:uncharacterized protein LOC134825005 n=1 Tax=Bolinopsis microptera TaxID=2820187 RepID=UPI00307A1ACE
MFNNRWDSRFKTSSSSTSSAKRRGCGPISGTKGRRSTVMNDVKNVQNSINLLNNLVTAKRGPLPVPACRDIINKIPSSSTVLSASADTSNIDPCDPLVKLVPFIDPVLPYRTSSPCRSNFRTLSTITQFRRSVSLNRVSMAPSLTSINNADSMFSLSDIRSPPREERPSKLSPCSLVCKDSDSPHTRHPDSKHHTASTDPLDNVQCTMYNVPDSQVTRHPLNTTFETVSSNQDSPRDNRRRLFNRGTAGSSVSDSQPTSLSSYYTNLEEDEEEEEDEEDEEEDEEDDIKQVCIERWLCGIPGDSSSADGKSIGVSIRGLEEEECHSSRRTTAQISLDRSSSEDGFLCNCEFGGPDECCIFHNTSLGGSAPMQRSFNQDVSTSAYHSPGKQTYTSQKCGRSAENMQRKNFDPSNIDGLSISDSTEDITDLLSGVELGFRAHYDDSQPLDMESGQSLSTSGPRYHYHNSTNSDDNNASCTYFQSDNDETDLKRSGEMDQETNSLAKTSHNNSNRILSDTRQMECLDTSDSSITSETLVTCKLGEESVSGEKLPSKSDDSEIVSKDCNEKIPTHSSAISSNSKYLSAHYNLEDVPKAKSPCVEDFDKMSEDSFFTESDSNSLIGGIIRSMVGV